MKKWRYGFEHETGFVRPGGVFADHTNTSYKEFQGIVDRLPLTESDYPTLRVGDLKIKHKRWYVEGYERFDEKGELSEFVPKGIETRTLPHDSIADAQSALAGDFTLLKESAAQSNLAPAWISYHPYQSNVVIDPVLNAFEQRRMEDSPEERTGYLTVNTFGPDINMSADFTDAELVEIAQKLTYWSPFIVPFSFSSPFSEGKLWGRVLDAHLCTYGRSACGQSVYC
jgi:hypothetical protein